MPGGRPRSIPRPDTPTAAPRFPSADRTWLPSIARDYRAFARSPVGRSTAPGDIPEVIRLFGLRDTADRLMAQSRTETANAQRATLRAHRGVSREIRILANSLGLGTVASRKRAASAVVEGPPAGQRLDDFNMGITHDKQGRICIPEDDEHEVHFHRRAEYALSHPGCGEPWESSLLEYVAKHPTWYRWTEHLAEISR